MNMKMDEILTLDSLDNHNPIVALPLYRATVERSIRTSVPWDRKRILRSGSVVYVTPATNQPEDGKIQWWVMRIVDNPNCGLVHDCENAYGVGLGDEDLTLDIERL
jgi:hypothetical protein